MVHFVFACMLLIKSINSLLIFSMAVTGAFKIVAGG